MSVLFWIDCRHIRNPVWFIFETFANFIIMQEKGISCKQIQGGKTMRIQHNITALNAHRNLTNNNSALTKNLEKLSSGYRINRAGDDAAGLAIS